VERSGKLAVGQLDGAVLAEQAAGGFDIKQLANASEYGLPDSRGVLMKTGSPETGEPASCMPPDQFGSA
jgi:hypothetical protein